MELNVLLTQQVGVTSQDKNSLGGHTAIQNFLFGNILASDITTPKKSGDEFGVSPTADNIVSLHTQALATDQDAVLKDFDLAQSILALESALFDLARSNIDEEISLGGVIQVALSETDHLNIDQRLQFIIKTYLAGQPPSPKKVKEDTSVSDGILNTEADNFDNAFAGTEDITSAEELFTHILKNVSQKLEDEHIDPEQLIASGLSIEEITLLTATIRTKLDKAEQHANPAIKTSIKEPNSLKAGSNHPDTNDQDDLPDLLGLTNHTNSEHIKSLVERGELPSDIVSRFEQFQAALKSASNEAAPFHLQAQAKTPSTAGSATNNNIPQATTDFLSFLGGMSAEEFSEFADKITQQWLTPAGQMPSPLNNGNLTSLVTQTTHASASHPASAMIAASIQKHAASGQTRNWLLQLDPPELGRVEVRLSFHKDKGMKAHMVVEKPETWMMLQRDAHLLEKSLQEIGLDSTHQDLSFELAQDENGFSHNGNHDGSSGYNNASNEETIEIIETHMNWYVDPDSGIQRYDLMV